MKSISKLKDDARKHELKEEWDKAVHLYLQVLRVGEEGEGEVELPLFNRVGDLYVRLGRPDQAVIYYEQAADRYAEAGLYNNAIALCNKALRYNPDQPELLRKLGQFSASQGFLTDARRYFLQFAEKKFSVGDVNEALSALEDFANVADDPEIREMLGRQLNTHGRHEEALQELRRAHTGYASAGQADRADAVLEAIRSIDPAAAIEPPEAGLQGGFAHAPEVEHESAAGALSDFEFGSAPGEPEEPLPTLDFGGTLDGIESTPSGSEVEPVVSLEVTGFDDADADDAPGIGTIEGLEATSLDFGAAAADLGAADFGLEFERDATSFDELPDEDPPSAAGRSASLDLPGLDDDAAELDLTGFGHAEGDDSEYGEEGVFELPTLDHDDDDAKVLDLPTFGDDDDALVELPSPDDGGDQGTFALPSLDDPEGGAFELPGFDDDDADATAAFELPSLDDDDVDATAAFELPSLDDDDADATEAFELPVLAADDAIPTLEEPDQDDVAWQAGLHIATDDVLEPSHELSARDDGDPSRPSKADGADIPPGGADEWATDIAAALTDGLDDTSPELEWRPADTSEVDSLEGEPGDVAAVDATAEAEAAAKAQAEMSRGWTPADLMGDAPTSTDAEAAAEEPAAPAGGGTGSGDDGFIDLGALIAEDGPETTRFRVQETAPTGDEDQDFAELLTQFKAKVSEHLPAEDAAAHYDLGLAFKEMGLIDEAISEFQIAMRAGHMRLKVYEELGDCFLQKQQFNIAEKVLRRGLEMQYDDELELLGVYYFLGRAYEGMGRRDQARDAYERVLGLDINFQDVSERLARL
jgi:tetratricopeptide (TPR) repeat protein